MLHAGTKYSQTSMRKRMKISDLQIFIKVAKLQSITAAAKKLDMSSSAASVAIKRIEHSLGKQLFVRTTRQLKLSPEGESYLPLCQQALDLLQQGQTVINKEQLSINGDIRIAMSSEMGRNLMRNLLNEIMSQHKDLSLSLHVSDSRVDFYRDNVDVALRALTKSAVKELNLYGFKICNIPHFLCASPNYTSLYGAPNSPNELPQHNTLLYKLYEVTHDNWEFYQNEKKYKVKVTSDRTVNDGDIVRRWCIDGVGIAKKSAIDIVEAFKYPQTVPVKQSYEAFAAHVDAIEGGLPKLGEDYVRKILEDLSLIKILEDQQIS